MTARWSADGDRAAIANLAGRPAEPASRPHRARPGAPVLRPLRPFGVHTQAPPRLLPAGPVTDPTGKDAMKYADFATQLARHPDHELVFELAGTPIRRGYHLTEVIATTVDAIDCGGAVDRWTETVLQLVEPTHDDATRFLGAGKVAGILQRSQAAVPLDADSRLLLEFRAPGAGAAQRFHVTGVQPGGAGQLRVLSDGARTQCKAAARSRPASGAQAAAGPCCAAGVAAPAGSAARGCCA
ncbi:MAG: DUF6428 family protein [Gammaproteobacteria bacterium]